MAVLWILLVAILGFVALLVVRALMFRPKEQPPVESVPIEVDADTVATHMQAMVRLATVSSRDPAHENAEALDAFPALLKELYPNVEAACLQERIGTRGLLYHWKGKSTDQPSVFMAHYDVVPAEAALWSKPPFEGVIEDGILWGRGTLDTKGTLLGVMEAADRLIAEGFVPAHDVYLCFGGNEEIGGDGAPGIVEALKQRGVSPAFVLDEGGAIVDGVFPGVAKPAALIGLGEKGTLNVTMRMEGQGGHASAPPPHTLVGALAQAVTRVEGKPFPFRVAPPVAALFDTLGRHSTFLYRVIFANLWCFAPVLDRICRRSGGELNALVRTTCAFTQMSGSDAPNVMPPAASVGANLRVISGETVETAVAYLKETIANPAITIETGQADNPSPDSRADGEPWARLVDAISANWPGTVVSPYLMLAASDSRHYAQISEHVYRFCPMPMSKEERGMIHGNDERIPIAKLADTVRFYIRLMRAS